MAKEQCPCLCHDLGGGPAHYGKKCKCNGGTGISDVPSDPDSEIWTVGVRKNDE